MRDFTRIWSLTPNMNNGWCKNVKLFKDALETNNE